MATPPKTLTLEEAKNALKEVVAAFDNEENKKRMDDAIAAAEGDFQKLMMTVVPIAMEIQMQIIEMFGFEANQQGAMGFMMAIQAHMSDPEIEELSATLKSRYMPKTAPPNK